VSDRLQHDANQKDCVRTDEHHEILVVAIAQAVVDERAVVVKVLDAAAACIAVERCLSFHELIIGAEVLKRD